MMDKHHKASFKYTKWALALFVILAASTGHALADVPMDERASVTGGYGAWMLSSLFESGSLNDMPADKGIVGAVITPFSLVCAMVVVLVMMIKGVQHVLIAAQARDIEQSPISMTWAPIHMVFAVALAVPLPWSGYSMGQYVGIWVAEQSNLLGNLTAERSVDSSEYGLITEIPLPGVRTTVQGIVDAHVCKAMFNALGQYMESQGGSGVQVEPVVVSDSDTLTRLVGPASKGFSGNGEPKRNGVTFSITRTGTAGNFVNSERDALDFCGSVVVEYDAYFGDTQVWQRPPQPAPDGSGGQCAGGILCGEEDVTRNEDKRVVAQAFQGAHEQLESLFVDRAVNGSGRIGAAVDYLTWDVDLYFEALTDPDKMEAYHQSQYLEEQQIERAALAIKQEIDRLQSDVVRAYMTAIDQLRSRNQSTGDSFQDAVMRTGWTVLGLYWFQQNVYNSAVLDSVNFNATARIGVGEIIRSLEAATGDAEFANRMANRLTEYRRAVNRKIMNTRLDPNPLQYAASGYSATSNTIALDEKIRASQMREELPTYLESLLDSGAQNQGAVLGDGDSFGPDVVTSTLFRDWIFPSVVGTMIDKNLMTSLVNTGHNLIAIAGTFYSIELMARSTSKWAENKASQGFFNKVTSFFLNPIDSAAGEAISPFATSWIGFFLVELLNDIKPVFLYLFLLGLFLAFYLPAVIMIQWLIGLIQWLIYVIEAVVVIPLWSVLFASDMGQKAFAPQTAQQGLIHLLSILFYPTLMIIGFTIGIKVLDLAGIFLIDYILIGFFGITSGYTFGPVSTVAGLTILAIIVYQVIMRIFSGMLELNDRAINWIGQRQTFGENSVEQAVRSGVVGIIQRTEGIAQKNGQRRDRPGTNKAPGVDRA
ncbi:hypothetical protein BTO32_14845 [Marinobacter lutaoensis]|uniref:Conjugal transfer protein TraY n=1 Tax=Marinobacter lutaoensis TaxID=135739 RepID=A0A1V2DPN4_9GAMM|nr:DotA/TraY family protein [Marinobacter lutaoensis]ONF42489.1 hypothetical protein BTO32_14845 [Marinobacter lutaoensis]